MFTPSDLIKPHPPAKDTGQGETEATRAKFCPAKINRKQSKATTGMSGRESVAGVTKRLGIEEQQMREAGRRAIHGQISRGRHLCNRPQLRTNYWNDGQAD